jgi:GDP-L-fucose synthase
MKVLVTGKNGLVGNAIKNEAKGHEFIFVGRENGDLTSEQDVEEIFQTHKPDWVIHTAAKVGGIGGNLMNAASFYRDNILMNTHIIHNAWKYNVKKLVVFSSVCCFSPKLEIMREDYFHEGEPYEANASYGWSKRMVDIQISAYKKQYGIKNYCSFIPNNIFGPNDLYNLETGHVLPCLIHKLYLAKKNGTSFNIWGDGTPRREFIYSYDLARMILKIIEMEDIPQRIIASSGIQVSIKDMVEKLCKVADFNGEVVWETEKPNGQQARRCDLSLLKSLIGDFEYTDLDKAVETSYKWFEDNYEKARK